MPVWEGGRLCYRPLYLVDVTGSPSVSAGHQSAPKHITKGCGQCLFVDFSLPNEGGRERRETKVDTESEGRRS